MDKVKVKIEYPNYFEVEIEFETNKETLNLCNEINNFWSGSEHRLHNADNCIYQCVTRLIAQEIIRLHCKSYFYTGVDSAIKAFNEGIEGFPNIDGSSGIKLLSCDDFDLTDFDVEFTKEEYKEVS